MKKHLVVAALLLATTAYAPAQDSKFMEWLGVVKQTNPAQPETDVAAPVSEAADGLLTAEAVGVATETLALSQGVNWNYRAEDLPREIDSLKAIGGLFDNPQDVLNLLREEPEYIYRRGQLNDPMVIPWKRWEVIAADVYQDAINLSASGRKVDALDTLARILSDERMRNTLAARQAVDLRTRLQQEIEAAKRADEEARRQGVRPGPKVKPTPTPEPPKSLPLAVSGRVAGILWSEKDPRVMLGDDMLAVGDPVPGHPEVTVKRIEKTKVVFEFDQREHVIDIDALRADFKKSKTR